MTAEVGDAVQHGFDNIAVEGRQRGGAEGRRDDGAVLYKHNTADKIARKDRLRKLRRSAIVVVVAVGPQPRGSLVLVSDDNVDVTDRLGMKVGDAASTLLLSLSLPTTLLNIHIDSPHHIVVDAAEGVEQLVPVSVSLLVSDSMIVNAAVFALLICSGDR